MQRWHRPDPMRGPDLEGCTLAVEFLRTQFPQEVPLPAVQQEIVPALMTGQAEYSLSESGDIDAILTWAHVSYRLHLEFMSGKRRLLDATEWNEGLNTWLMHAIPSDARQLRHMVRTTRRLVRDYGKVCFAMVRQGRVWIYSLSENRGTLVLEKLPLGEMTVE